MRALLLVAALTLSAAFSAQADTSPYAQICESASLRALERADCHAQMKAATSDEQRRLIFRTFDIKANGSTADAG